jgi:hypothetical protein
LLPIILADYRPFPHRPPRPVFAENLQGITFLYQMRASFANQCELNNTAEIWQNW